jgi:hypothetical protein
LRLVHQRPDLILQSELLQIEDRVPLDALRCRPVGQLYITRLQRGHSSRQNGVKASAMTVGKFFAGLRLLCRRALGT